MTLTGEETRISAVWRCWGVGGDAVCPAACVRPVQVSGTERTKKIVQVYVGEVFTRQLLDRVLAWPPNADVCVLRCQTDSFCMSVMWG